jgi:hypothetical protein
VIAASALRYQPRRPAGTISTKGNGVYALAHSGPKALEPAVMRVWSPGDRRTCHGIIQPAMLPALAISV